MGSHRACGIALTPTQAEWISRAGTFFPKPIVLAYDGDTAGEAATWRAWDLLRDAGVRGLCLSDIPKAETPGNSVTRNSPRRSACLPGGRRCPSSSSRVLAMTGSRRAGVDDA